MQLETGTASQVLQSPKQSATNKRLVRHSSGVMLKQCCSTAQALNWQFLKVPSPQGSIFVNLSPQGYFHIKIYNFSIVCDKLWPSTQSSHNDSSVAQVECLRNSASSHWTMASKSLLTAQWQVNKILSDKYLRTTV